MAFVLFALLGGLSYPLYSIAGAYTNDWVEPEHLNAAASQLVTLYLTPVIYVYMERLQGKLHDWKERRKANRRPRQIESTPEPVAR